MGIVQNAALHALYHALEKGERHAAFLALRGLDPLLRWQARRSLLEAFRFADLTTNVGSEPHRIRVAGLRVLRHVPESGYEDEARVESEFAERLQHAAVPARGPWLLGAGLGSALALGLIAALLYHYTAAFDPKREPLGTLLGPELTDYVVQSSRATAAERAALRERFAAQTGATLPAESAEALNRTLLAMTRVLDANNSESPADTDALNAIVNGAVAFDAALAHNHAPYFVDVDWLQRGTHVLPYLFTFYIERERQINAGAQNVRVVHLWRLDSLSIEQGYLGYTRPHSPAALVLLDQVEADLIADVLPALPDAETMDLVDFATRRQGKPWVSQVELATAMAVRRHFAALPAEQQTRYRDVGALLAERRSLVRNWQDTLSELGAGLVVPVRLIPEANYLEELELKVPREQLRRWESVHDRLLSADTVAAFSELRDNFVAAVERHEVQHRIDYKRELFEVPPVLVRRLGVNNPLAAEAGTLVGRARDEFSAYLATIASTEPTPLLDLALLARFLFNREAFAGAYTYAALGVYEALAEQLDLAKSAREQRVLERPALAKLVTAVLAQDPGTLRAAALAAYQIQTGSPVLPVSIESERKNTSWRH